MSVDLLLINNLGRMVSPESILTDEESKSYYCKGFRVGYGQALVVVLPGTLLELWNVIKVCNEFDVIILMQASNTGVTGGSTPDGNNYDRKIVIISTRKIKGIHVIDDAKQVLAFPGSTLTELEQILKPLHREPHSVIGSSCMGASIVGGICNNSGGSLIRRGPAFTEKSLFAQINQDGRLSLVNHLGIDLGDSPEEIINNLENKNYSIGTASDWKGRIWADDYAATIKDTAASTPSRFNGNPHYLHDSAGSAGKVIVFAVRLPTFEICEQTDTFYIGAANEALLLELRKYLIDSLDRLPIQAEYIHSKAFALALRYAKHILLTIKLLGPGVLPRLMTNKARWDSKIKKLGFLPHNFIDKLIQLFNRITPNFLSKRIMDYHKKYEHHLIVKVERPDALQMESLLSQYFKSKRNGEYFHCNAKEQTDAFLLRFTVGGCTIFYCDYHGIDANQRLVAFDAALRRNDEQWLIKLPSHLQDQVLESSCCGHFFCMVNHQDYILKPGIDHNLFKQDVIAYLESRGAKYPAEHNVGHLYHASEPYKNFFKELDPTNSCNPGIGKTSKHKYWVEL